MMYATTLEGAASAVSDYFYSTLAALEDFDTFCSYANKQMHLITSRAIALSLERFNNEIDASIPSSWEIRGKPYKRVITMIGEVVYQRTLYKDEYGRNRYPLDEILGIPKRARISADAHLWLARRSTAVSYRRAADDFFQMSGVRVSGMCAWRAVQIQAELIRKDTMMPSVGDISQTEVFAESDGIYIAFQTPKRRAQARSRFLYEQSRSKTSFEMKCGVVYAGIRSHKSRRVRGNVALLATCGSTQDFQSLLVNTIKADYVVEDIERIHFSSDGGQWCKAHGLDDLGKPVVQGIDLFHVMKYIHRAFPEGRGREYLVSLALKRRPEAFVSACKKIALQIKNENRKKKIYECCNYITSNAELLRNDASLGTMEATNATVWAKRMKSFGCSWSKKGAEAMALVLCRVCANRPLIVPKKDVLFSEQEQAQALKVMAEKGSAAARMEIVGEGWLPPFNISTWKLPKNKQFRARTC